MAESMRSTRLVLSMRSTLPRSALSAQKLKPEARMRSVTPESPEPWSRLPPSAWSDSSTITTTGASARMALNAFSWLRSDWPTYICAQRAEAHAQHPALLGEALGQVALAGARRAHEDDAHGRGRGEAAPHDVGHLAQLARPRAPARRRPRGRSAGSGSPGRRCTPGAAARSCAPGSRRGPAALRVPRARCTMSSICTSDRPPVSAASSLRRHLPGDAVGVARLQAAREVRAHREVRPRHRRPPPRRTRPRRPRPRRRPRWARSARSSGRRAASRSSEAQRASVVMFCRSAPPVRPAGREACANSSTIATDPGGQRSDGEQRVEHDQRARRDRRGSGPLDAQGLRERLLARRVGEGQAGRDVVGHDVRPPRDQARPGRSPAARTPRRTDARRARCRGAGTGGWRPSGSAPASPAASQRRHAQRLHRREAPGRGGRRRCRRRRGRRRAPARTGTPRCESVAWREHAARAGRAGRASPSVEPARNVPPAADGRRDHGPARRPPRTGARRWPGPARAGGPRGSRPRTGPPAMQGDE